MTPEAKIKEKVKKVIKELGGYYNMTITGGFGNSGAPDFIVCYKGRFVGIECKAGKGKTTLLQEKHLKEINVAGGIAFVVNESNIDNLTNLIIERIT